MMHADLAGESGYDCDYDTGTTAAEDVIPIGTQKEQI